MSKQRDRDDDKPHVDYEVGYGKPPLHSRFKPGQSGNPRGRPKGTKNLKTDLAEELRERVVIREGGQSKEVTKQQAVIKAILKRTLQGDSRASTLLTSLMMRLLDTGEGAPSAEEALGEDEREILRRFEDRLRRGVQHAAHAPDESSDFEEHES